MEKGKFRRPHDYASRLQNVCVCVAYIIVVMFIFVFVVNAASTILLCARLIRLTPRARHASHTHGRFARAIVFGSPSMHARYRLKIRMPTIHYFTSHVRRTNIYQSRVLRRCRTRNRVKCAKNNVHNLVCVARVRLCAHLSNVFYSNIPLRPNF